MRERRPRGEDLPATTEKRAAAKARTKTVLTIARAGKMREGEERGRGKVGRERENESQK